MTENRNTALDYCRADFRLYRDQLGQVSWDTALERRGAPKRAG